MVFPDLLRSSLSKNAISRPLPKFPKDWPWPLRSNSSDFAVETLGTHRVPEGMERYRLDSEASELPSSGDNQGRQYIGAPLRARTHFVIQSESFHALWNRS